MDHEYVRQELNRLSRFLTQANRTSINLSEETVSEFKVLATKKGLPYQALMRMLILDGIARLKKSA